MNMDSPTNKYRNESTRLKKRDYEHNPKLH